jgi:hypothetical protein
LCSPFLAGSNLNQHFQAQRTEEAPTPSFFDVDVLYKIKPDHVSLRQFLILVRA